MACHCSDGCDHSFQVLLWAIRGTQPKHCFRATARSKQISRTKTPTVDDGEKDLKAAQVRRPQGVRLMPRVLKASEVRVPDRLIRGQVGSGFADKVARASVHSKTRAGPSKCIPRPSHA